MTKTTIKNITHTNYMEKMYRTTTSDATLIISVRRPVGDSNPITWQGAYDDPSLPDTEWFALTVQSQDFPTPSPLPNSGSITGLVAFRIIPTYDAPDYTMVIEEIVPTPPGA